MQSALIAFTLFQGSILGVGMARADRPIQKREQAAYILTGTIIAEFTCMVFAAEPVLAPKTKPDLKTLQGNWVLKDSSGTGKEDEGKLLGLSHDKTTIRIEGNRLFVSGKQEPIVFANDLPLPQEQEQVYKGNQLIFFTLSDGKGILGSYKVSGDKLEVLHPHTCTCPRTGVIMRFERVKK